MDEAYFPWKEFYKRAVDFEIRIEGWSNRVAMCPGGVGFRYNSLRLNDWAALYELAIAGRLRIVSWTEGTFNYYYTLRVAY